MVASPKRSEPRGPALDLTRDNCPRLYVIADAEVCAAAGWTIVDLVADCLEAGARLIQIRAKTMTGQAFLDAAEAAVGLAAPAGALVVVNDRADIARAAGAAGVHVGQDDLSPAAARIVVGESPIVGLSTHSPEQLVEALAQPITYAAMGPVFGTVTKETGYDARGVEAVRRAASLTSAAGKPLVAIGGITLDRAASVIDAGAQSVAVISDLLRNGRPADRVREFLQALA